MLIALLFLACHQPAEVVDFCEPEVEECLECTADSECLFQGNDCLEAVYCAHEVDEVIVPMLGCSEAITYRWPPDEECRCVQGACSAEE